ncbi:MAG: hypothetical protein H7Z21_16240 [Hymenobacter sp.]|nr:hypothetical protein [Hymenobacter sp.]
MANHSSTPWPTALKAGTTIGITGAVLAQMCRSLSLENPPRPWLHPALVAGMLLVGLGLGINMVHYWRHDRALFTRKVLLLGIGLMVAVGAYFAVNGWLLPG